MSTNDIRQTNDLTIIIPAAIAIRPDLNLLEKAVLAHIGEFPACSNAGLSKLCGLSERGIESLLARLRKRGFLQRLGEGRARRHEVLLHMERHTHCGKEEVGHSHAECGQRASGESHSPCAVGTPTSPVCKLVETTGEFSERQFTLHDNCIKEGLFDDARKHLELLRAQVELNTEIPVDQRTEWVRGITNPENRCFAWQTLENAASNNELSLNQLRAAAARVGKADPARLALFRQRVEAGALAANVPNLFAAIDG